MRLAVIPARGGSKRIPRKNIKSFCGKPMIAWSIEAARASGCFDRIIVSTDDAEIAKVATSAGAEAPFLRPKELSDDHTGTLPVIAHAIRWFAEAGFDPTEICCVYATAPFVQPQDLVQGLERLLASGGDYAFSACAYPFPIQRAFRLTATGGAEMANPGEFKTRSQDLEEFFHDAGQFYWGRAEAWLEERPVFSPVSQPIILPRDRVEDIDTPEDWRRAEWLFEALRAR
jgi:pseudaminic acid cytidylyltransferase